MHRSPRIVPALLLTAMLSLSSAWAEELKAGVIQAPVQQPATLSPAEPVTLQGMLTKTEPYPIDLPIVLKLVEDQNLNIAREAQTVKIATSQYRLSQVAVLPNIAGSLTQSKYVGGVQVFGGAVVDITRVTVQPQISGNWTLYPGGKQVYDILASKRRRDAADFQLKETYQQQLSRAAEEYYQLLAAQYEQIVAAKSVAQAQEQVKLNQARLRIGTGTKLELMQAETLLAQQQRRLIEAENAVAQSEQVLLDRLNLEPTIQLVATETQVGEQRLVPESITPEALLAWASQNNPALKRAQQIVKAFQAEYGSVRSGFIPSITLSTYLNGVGPQYQNLALSRFGGFVVNMNLLDNLGLKVPFQLQEKRGEINRSIVEEKRILREIQTRILSAFLDSRAANSAIATAKQERDSAEESLRLATGRFQAGVGINLDVITAQVAVLNAQTNLIRAMLNFNQAQVRLVEAIGAADPRTIAHGIQSILQPSGSNSKGNPTTHAKSATP